MIGRTLLLALLLSAVAQAQVSISSQLPPGLIQKDQLWDISLVNNGSNAIRATLQLSLLDVQSGQVVLTATTGTVILQKGFRAIRASDLQPITYTYGIAAFARKFLPLGEYTACFQVLEASNDRANILAEDCGRISVEALSPPQLATPLDRTTIESPYPQFSWIPPTPLEVFTGLHYDLTIAEVLPGQSPSEAVQYNMPILTLSNLNQAFGQYAANARKLDAAKTYAWQVVARNDLNYSVKTEVWTFRVAGPSPLELILKQTPFVRMRKEAPDKTIAPNGILKLSYTNESVDSFVTVQVRDLNLASAEPYRFKMKVRRGENLLQQDLNIVFKPLAQHTYEAMIVASGKEIWRLLFEVIHYNDKQIKR